MARFSRARTQELDLKLRPLIEEQRLQHHVVAEMLGVSEDWVQRACKRLELSTQRRGPRTGEGHPDWNGGRILIKGYQFVYAPDHPSVRYGRYVAEHRLVAEQKLGRFLGPLEVVHHIDGNPLNNDPSNLQVFATNGEHLKHELTGSTAVWGHIGEKRFLVGFEKATASHQTKEFGGDLPQQ